MLDACIMSVLQLIDEDKRFSSTVANYFDRIGIRSNGLKYHIISVFGSQSSGKSTLLNALFGTRFGVMDDSVRGQTTKGIWMGHSGPQEDPVLILDVEGTDGRERGEDQDFERKAALFALATSEVLIVNLWETQVGLYQGANMGLLRTVFEVDLSLFASGGRKPTRSKILFVIRDHLGQTPLENLAKILRAEMDKHWASISKPVGLETSHITDFFDLEFTALPHKVLQQAAWDAKVKDLAKELCSDTGFKPEYHRNVPLDGWPMYADHIWQEIELNKDLDLPTQQTLVARFRCEEIGAEAFSNFTAAVDALGLDLSGATVVSGFGVAFRKLRADALGHYDSLASRYNSKVYTEKRFELLGKIDGIITTYYQAQLNALKREGLALFTKTVTDTTFVHEKPQFNVLLLTAERTAHDYFVEGARDGIVDPSFYSYSTEEKEFDEAVEAEAARLRKAELARITKKLGKQVSKRLELIHLHFINDSNPWLAVHHALDCAVQETLAPYPDDDFSVGATPQETAAARKTVIRAAWEALAHRVYEMTRPEAVAQRLRDRFEEKFRYTAEGLPIVWTGKDDIDGACMAARAYALELLPLYSKAELEDGRILRPPFDSEDGTGVDDDEEDQINYAELLTPAEQEDVKRRLKRFADTAFVDAKRSAAQSESHIPLWVFAVILVLGWNEFMAVLRNPLLVVVCLVAGAGFYTLYSLNLTGPALNVARAMFDRVHTEAKAKLREYLVEANEGSSKVAEGANSKTASGSVDPST